jgi:hypothetical protein
MLGLTHQHVVFHPQGNGMSIILQGSKTSQGNPQVILVTDARLIEFAREVVVPKRAAYLWPHGAHQFRHLFAALLQLLGFSADSYTPYCLRRGGATWHFQSSLLFQYAGVDGPARVRQALTLMRERLSWHM